MRACGAFLAGVCAVLLAGSRPSAAGEAGAASSAVEPSPGPSDTALAALEAKRVEAGRLVAQWTPEALRRADGVLREVIRVAREAGAARLVAQALEDLIGIVEDDGQRLELLREAIAIRESLGDRTQVAKNLVRVGVSESRMGRKDEALAILRDALERLRALGDKDGEASALNELGVVQYWLAKYEDALANHERALELYEALGDAKAAGFALNFIARTHSRLGRDRQALEIYRRAYDAVETLADPKQKEHLQVAALANMANTHLDLGEAEQAESLLGKACAQVEVSQTPGLLPAILALRGRARGILGEPGPALDDFTRALTIYRETKNRSREANVVRHMGDIYGELGDWDRALAHHRSALSALREMGDRQSEALVLYRIGADLLALKQWAEAARHLEEALAFARTSGERPLQAMILNRLGDARTATAQPEAALESLTESLALHRSNGSRRGEAAVLSSLGRLYADTGRDAPAAEYLAQALDLRRATSHRSGEAEALYDIAALHWKNGRLADARRAAREALDVIESLRGAVTSDTLRASFLASKQECYDLLVDTLLRMHEKEPAAGYVAEALEVSERARARSLLDTLRERRIDIREGVDRTLLAQEGELRRLLGAKAFAQESFDTTLSAAANDLDRRLRARETHHARLLERAAPAADVDTVNLEIATLVDEYREIQRRIRAASPHYAALTEPRPATIAEIQHGVLDADTALLEYFLGTERSVLWLVTGTTVAAFELPPRRVIEETARRFSTLLQARSQLVEFETERERRRRVAEADAALPVAARALSDLVLGPLASRRPEAKRLLIVAHGALQYVPFAALPWPGGEDRSPLLADYEITHAPSASVLRELRQEPEPHARSAKTVAILADPVFGADDSRVIGLKRSPGAGGVYLRLPHTRVEAENIVKLVGKERVLNALGFEASRATVTSPAVAEYAIVHLATHGFVDSERPELSGLVLSLVNARGEPEDGILRLHDIYNLKLRAGLVVLSACQTALGKDIRGEGMVGLTRGFMYAGARRVVASLWSSPDRATSELMSRFYQNMLKEGRAPSAALRAAQLSLRQSRRWEAPYYWAGFIVQGDWR